jgi:hypothetical protein
LLACPQRPRILHRHRRDPVTTEHLREQCERLRDARHDDDVAWVHPDPTVTGQPIGDGETQRRRPPRISVPEVRRDEAMEYGAFRA